jgi:hypothetical protein
VKRGCLEHFKTARLARALSTPERPCDVAEALGILEALCNHFAPRSCPQGNVGRCEPWEIALGVRSTRDPENLVRALVASGWLDEHPEYGLLIHDWPEHADESVRKWLLRNKLPWLTPSGPRRVTVRTSSRLRLDAVDPPRAGNGKGKGKGSVSRSSSGGGAGEPSTFDRFWGDYPRKTAKADARAVWAKLAPDTALLERILEALAWQRMSADWTREGGQYVPYPATYLNRRRWEDERPDVVVPLFTKRGQQTADAAQEWLRRTTAPVQPSTPAVALEGPK